MSNSDLEQFINKALVGEGELSSVKKSDYSKFYKFARSLDTYSTGNFQSLKELLKDAESASVPSDEIYELFSKPLPKDDVSARKALSIRISSLRRKIEYQNGAPIAFISRLRSYLVKTQENIDEIQSVKNDRYHLSDSEENCFEEFQNLIKDFDAYYLAWTAKISERCFHILDQDWGKMVYTGQDITLTDSQTDEALDFIRNYNLGGKVQHRLFNQIVPEYWQFKKKFWHMRRSLKVFDSLIPKPVSDVSVHEVLELTEQQKNDPRFMFALDKIGHKKYCDVEDLAKLLDKGESKHITKIKAVKRWFKILKPLGTPGEDYRVVEATESHVRQGVAVEVGAPVFNYIQGRTAFDTTEAINVYWMVWMVKDVTQQLRKELGYKPTLEEVASEMGIEPSKLRYLYN